MAMIRDRVEPNRAGNLFTRAARRIAGRTDEQRRTGFIANTADRIRERLEAVGAEESEGQQALGGQRQSRPRSGAGRSVMGKTRLV